jgi:hypothetical protein
VHFRKIIYINASISNAPLSSPRFFKGPFSKRFEEDPLVGVKSPSVFEGIGRSEGEVPVSLGFW